MVVPLLPALNIRMVKLFLVSRGVGFWLTAAFSVSGCLKHPLEDNAASPCRRGLRGRRELSQRAARAPEQGCKPPCPFGKQVT